MIYLNELQKDYYKKARTIEQGTFQKSNGMYLGEQNDPSCKENKNILRTMITTQDWSDTITIKCGTYQRNYLGHKKGDVKYKKILKKYPSNLTPTLKAAWIAAFDFPTVSYGLSCWRREAIIIDSDFEYKSLDEAFNMISKFEKTFQIPQHNYILQNPKTGHCQFGWFISPKEYFAKAEFPKFNEIIKIFAKGYTQITGFQGDICFNGPACKNPFYEGFESRIDCLEMYSKQKFIDLSEKMYNKLYISSLSSPLYYNNTVVTKNITVKETIKSFTSKRGGKHYFGDETSRDYWEAKLLREWIWDYIRKNNKNPTSKESRAALDKIAEKAATLSGKNIKHSEAELNNLNQCTYKWAISKFKAINNDCCKEGEYTDSAKFGNYIQKLQSYILMGEIWKEEGTCRDIANKIGCSAMTVSRALKTKTDIEKLYQINKDISNFNKYCSQFDSLSVEYTSLRYSLNQILLYINSLSSFLYYNNTVVTNDNDSYNDIEKYLDKENKTINELNNGDKYVQEQGISIIEEQIRTSTEEKFSA